MRHLGEAVRFRAGGFQAHQRRIGALFCFDILAGAFAEFFARLRHVEDVVDDLKGQAGGHAEVMQRLHLLRAGAGAHAAQLHAGGEQRGSFAFMDKTQILQRQLFALALQIGHLTAHEVQAACRACEFQHHHRRGMTRRHRCLRHQFKRQGLQGIPRQQCDGLAIDLVAGRYAAAHVVVVHAGQVIVNERVGVQALDGTGIVNRILCRAATGFRRCEAEDRPQPFAAGEHAVSHRLVQGHRTSVRARDETVQRCINKLAALGEVFFEIGHGLIVKP